MNFKRDESAEKLRGGYYTPPDVARFLARWVLQASPRRVLEPSCGDGAFLEALAQESRARAKSGPVEVVACELDPREASRARERARAAARATGGALRARVHTAEFLEWSLDHADDRLGGVVGNPPFIRYQYLEPDVQERAGRIHASHGLRFTKHVNAWVPFLVASIGHLEPGGRLGMVVPAELLHVLHAGAARELLLRCCKRVLVVDPETLWFDRALQGVVLLLAERASEPPTRDSRSSDPLASGAAKRRGVAIVRTKDRSILDEDPESIVRGAHFVAPAALRSPDAKWMEALLDARQRELLQRFREHPAVHRFADVADVEVGIVTGANRFFLVSDETVDRYQLEPWVRPMFGRSEHVRGVIHEPSDQRANRDGGLPAHFVGFGSAAEADLPEGPRRYLAEGEAQGLHHRYKCRIREPWWNVPSVWAAPVAMLKRSHHYPRLVLNRADALTTDTAYRVRPRGVSATALVASFVNPLTALCAELGGRHYGGGVLELVPSEIDGLHLPLLSDPRRALAKLDGLVRSGADATDVLAQRGELLCAELGLPVSAGEQLLGAWNELRNRRQRTGA